MKIQPVTEHKNSQVCGYDSCSTCATKLAVSAGSKSKPTRNSWINTQLVAITFSVVILITAVLIGAQEQIVLGLYLISYVVAGGPILFNAVRNLVKGRIFDENFLMSVATIGAFIIGEYLEGVAVMIFYQTGEYLQNLAVNRSQRSIMELMDIRPDYAHKQTADKVITVSPDRLKVKDKIVVKPGERIPLDGIVIDGSTSLDTSALTGESKPQIVNEGSKVFSGSVNLAGLITVEVTKTYDQSTASKIVELVQKAADRKAPTENFITKFAKYYTPIVVFLALGLAIIPPLLTDASFSHWGYRALIFLIISCPCALVISIPLSFFGGIGAASHHGVLVKGSNYLEAFNEIDTIAFDKTGTLTKGIFQATKIESHKIPPEQLLKYAAYGESFSNHPIAISILKAYGKPIDQTAVKNYTEIPGYGIQAVVKDKEILLGNEKLLKQHQVDYPPVFTSGSIVYLAIDQKYAGFIIVEDAIKPEASSLVAKLKQLGIKTLVMLSGDQRKYVEAISKQLGIDRFHAELLPEDKVNIVDSLINDQHKVAFIGDGMNDAPVLARADLGIAMGGIGSDAAIEAADVVLMTDDIDKVATGIRIARYTRKIVWQNITIALGIKALILLLGTFGLASLWEAIFADVGVTLIAVINATRTLKVKF